MSYSKDYNEVLRYSKEAFLKKIKESPTDVNHRGVLADWLEDHEPQSVTPVHLDRLRNSKEPLHVTLSPNGKVLAIPFVTKANSENVNRFYHVSARYSGKNGTAYESHRNGKTQLWKTRPDEFRIPIKIGYKDTGNITHNNNEWLIESPTEEPTE